MIQIWVDLDTYKKIIDESNLLKTMFITSDFDYLLKRLLYGFHGPSRSGKSLHGVPEQKI